jgi:hypothetical protein
MDEAYERHLAAARTAVESNPGLVPSLEEQRQRRGNYLPLLSAAVAVYTDRHGPDYVRFLLAKLVGEVVRGEV